MSIIICTYNRADILKVTLPSYKNMKIPEGVRLEIICVDNNSNDDTEAYLKTFIKIAHNRHITYKYCFESIQGLSHARNRGYQESSGNYIAYIDDECILPVEWLEIAVKHIKAKTPAFLGGPYYGKYLPGVSSKWFKESFGDSYILQYNLPDGSMNGRYLSGGNLIIRRNVFEKIGLFDTNLGMKGNTINYGEEQDLQKRFISQFPEESILYIADLFVWHLIRREKMTMNFLFKDALIRGFSATKLMNNHSNLKLFSSPLFLLFSVLNAILSYIYNFIISLFSKKSFFTLLYNDYKKGTWRNIGASWALLELLFRQYFKKK